MQGKKNDEIDGVISTTKSGQTWIWEKGISKLKLSLK